MPMSAIAYGEELMKSDVIFYLFLGANCEWITNWSDYYIKEINEYLVK